METCWRKIALLLALVILPSCGFRSAEGSFFRATIVDSLHEGDIVFRYGRGMVSRVVVMINDDCDYSHAGIVLRVDGRWSVVHSVPYEGNSSADDHIYCEDIYDFFAPSKAQTGAVYRAPIDSMQLTQIKGYLVEHLGCNTPFDHDYDLSDDRSLYCSEMVWRAFGCADIDLTQGRRTYNDVIPQLPSQFITPSDIIHYDGLSVVVEF